MSDPTGTIFNPYSRVTVNFSTAIQNAEVNLVETGRVFNFIAGFRYIEIQDHMRLRGNDLGGNFFEGAIDTYNTLLGGQGGVRCGHDFGLIRIEGQGKAGLYYNQGNAHANMNNNGVILAPPKNNLVLPGITYDVVLELAKANGLAHEVRAVTEAEVRDADGGIGRRSSRTTDDGNPVEFGKDRLLDDLIDQRHDPFAVTEPLQDLIRNSRLNVHQGVSYAVHVVHLSHFTPFLRTPDTTLTFLPGRIRC